MKDTQNIRIAARALAQTLTQEELKAVSGALPKNPVYTTLPNRKVVVDEGLNF